MGMPKTRGCPKRCDGFIGKREDPGDGVALGDVCIIGQVIIIIWFRSLSFSVVPLLS